MVLQDRFFLCDSKSTCPTGEALMDRLENDLKKRNVLLWGFWRFAMGLRFEQSALYG